MTASRSPAEEARGEPAGPILDLRVRWRLGQAALGLVGILTLLSFLRPMGPAAHPALRLAVTLLLGLGVAGTAFLASLRGHGRAEQWAFYAFLCLSLDGVGQMAAPLGWPAWPPMVLLLGAVAVAEPPASSLGLAALASSLALAGAAPSFAGWRSATAGALGYLALTLGVSRALRGERRRLAATLEELARLRHGIDHLDELDPGTASLRLSTTGLTLRQVSEEGRRVRQADRAAEVDEALAELVGVARRATGAHAVLYFDVDRKREVAFLRAADSTDALLGDEVAPLASDPFAFVVERGQPFYATDFPRLLWALPYHKRDVKIGSLLAMPVRQADVVCGVLVAEKLETQALTGREPQLLEAFATMASRSLRRARESEARDELGTEFKAVYSVSKSLARLGAPQPLRRLLVRSARDLVPSLEAAAVVTTDDSWTRYVVEAEAYGWPTDYAGREVALAERTWAAWILRSAEEPYLLDDLAEQKDRMPILVLDEGAGRAESLLSLPLRAGDRNLGALVLMGRRGAFDAAVLRVLGVLANQAAAALSTLRLIERNQQLAIRDGLTGLHNRRAFDEALAQTIAREDRKSGAFALLLLDLDHFKKLNDTLGHQAGDAALRHTADILARHLRRGDLAARYGGEEFVVILPGAVEEGAQQLAERVRVAIQKARPVFEGARISLTASLGAAVWPADGRDADALLAAADQALYAAKQGGRNRVVTASSLAPEGTPSG